MATSTRSRPTRRETASATNKREAASQKVFNETWPRLELLGWSREGDAFAAPIIEGHSAQIPLFHSTQAVMKAVRQMLVKKVTEGACSCKGPNGDPRFCDLAQPECLHAAKASLVNRYKKYAIEANFTEQAQNMSGGGAAPSTPSTAQTQRVLVDLSNTGGSSTSDKPTPVGSRPRLSLGSARTSLRLSTTPYVPQAQRTSMSGLAAHSTGGSSRNGDGDGHPSSDSTACTLSPRALVNECGLETETTAPGNESEMPSQLEQGLQELKLDAALRDTMVQLLVQLDDPVLTEETRHTVQSTLGLQLPEAPQLELTINDDEDPAPGMGVEESPSQVAGPATRFYSQLQRTRRNWEQVQEAVHANKGYRACLRTVIDTGRNMMSQAQERVDYQENEIEENRARVQQAEQRLNDAVTAFKDDVNATEPLGFGPDGQARCHRHLEDIQAKHLELERAQSDLKCSQDYLRLVTLVRDAVCPYLCHLTEAAQARLATARPDVRETFAKSEAAQATNERKLKECFDKAVAGYQSSIAEVDADIKDFEFRLKRDRRVARSERSEAMMRAMEDTEARIEGYRRRQAAEERDLRELEEEMEVYENEAHNIREDLAAELEHDDDDDARSCDTQPPPNNQAADGLEDDEDNPFAKSMAHGCTLM